MRKPVRFEKTAKTRPVFGDLAVIVAVFVPYVYLLGFIEMGSFLNRIGAVWANTLVQPSDILSHSLVMVFSISTVTVIFIYTSFYVKRIYSLLEKLIIPLGITPITFATGNKSGQELFDGVKWLPVIYVNYAVFTVSILVISVCLSSISRAWFYPEKRLLGHWSVLVFGFFIFNSLSVPQYYAAIRVHRIFEDNSKEYVFTSDKDEADKRLLIDKIGGSYLVRIESPENKKGFSIMSNLDGYILH